MTKFAEQSDPRYGPPSPVSIIQHETEFEQLLDLYVKWHPRRVLEVGTWRGGTLYHWLQNARPGTVVVSVDEQPNSRDDFAPWCAEGVEIQVIHGDSQAQVTADEAAVYGPFNWIFIDANHMEASVRADWALYAPLAASGATAVIALHDIADIGVPSVQVFRLWAELKEQYDTVEYVTTGTGIGVVFMP